MTLKGHEVLKDFRNEGDVKESMVYPILPGGFVTVVPNQFLYGGAKFILIMIIKRENFDLGYAIVVIPD